MKKRIFTWAKPTANQLHIWNYFWALKPIVDLQSDPNNEIIMFIPNMHALTTWVDPESMKQNTINVLKSYIAIWLDPNKVVFFKQSDVPAHAELNRVLWCLTTLWFMKRMHAYKDALDKWKADETTLWTFNYPILMAADILLYDVDIVPVWKDQKQHLEFARDIAEKFNNIYGPTLKLPQELIIESVATVPWIDWRKMSKSYNNFIWIFEDQETILKKVKTISTDALPIDASKDPDKCNVYNILKLFINEQENQEIRQKYTQWGLSYKDAKMYTYEKIMNVLWPIQQKANEISDWEIIKILSNGKQIASEIANKKIKEVYDKVWFNG